MSASNDDGNANEIPSHWAKVSVDYDPGATVYGDDLDDADSGEPMGPQQSLSAEEESLSTEQPDLAVTAPLADTLSGVRARLAAEEEAQTAKLAAADAELTAPMPVDVTTPLPQIIEVPEEKPQSGWPVMQPPSPLVSTPPVTQAPPPEPTTSGGSRLLPEQLVEEPEEPLPTHRKPTSNGRYYGRIGGVVGLVVLVLAFVWWVNPGQETPRQKPKVATSRSADDKVSPSPGKGDEETSGEEPPVAVSHDDDIEPTKRQEQSSPTKSAKTPEAPQSSRPSYSSTPQPSSTQGGGSQPSEEPPTPSSEPTHTTGPTPSSPPPATTAPPATSEPPSEEPTTEPSAETPVTSGASEETEATP